MVRGLEDGIFFPRICPGADNNKFIFRKMQPSSIYRILQKRAELALIGKVRPHDLRRTFATRMLEQGCDLFILQRAMGHTSVATTARYDFRSETSREKVCKNLEVFPEMLYYGRKYGIPIYTTGGTADAMLRMKSLGKMPEGLIHEIREDEPFEIKDLTVNPFTIPHDAAQPVGYRLECGEHSVGIATDLGKYNDYIVKNLENLDAVLLEANHDIRMLQVGKYPYYLKQRILGDRGHLSNENAGRLLCRILHDNLKAVFLGHLSRENNYEELAYETVCSEVTLGDNPYRSRDFKIQVAKRDHISEIITV